MPFTDTSKCADIPQPGLLLKRRLPPSDDIRDFMLDSPMPLFMLSLYEKPQPLSLYTTAIRPLFNVSDMFIVVHDECFSELLINSQITR